MFLLKTALLWYRDIQYTVYAVYIVKEWSLMGLTWGSPVQGTQKRGSVVRWLVGSEVTGGRKGRSPSPDWSWQRELLAHETEKAMPWTPVIKAGLCPRSMVSCQQCHPRLGGTRMAEALHPPCLILMFPAESPLHVLVATE